MDLATSTDFYARGIDSWSPDALGSVSAAVMDAAGGPVGRVSGTVALVGGNSQWLDLPTPATVTAVTVDGEAVTDWTAFPHALFRSEGWCPPSVVAVTGTFGYGEIPADIIQLVIDLTVLASAAVVRDPGIKSEKVDDYAVTYRDDAPLSVTIPKDTRRMLRARFGGTSAVTGSR